MAIDVTERVTIDRPRGKVAGFATDPTNDTAWIGGIVEATLLTEPPLALGSKVRRVATFLGKRIEYVTEIVTFEPDRRLHMRAVSGPFPMVVHYEFEDIDGGTRVEIRNQGSASGFFRVAEPLLAGAMRRSVRKDLQALKTRLETN